MSDYTTFSDDELIQIYHKLDQEMVKRSQSYVIFHINYNSRRRPQPYTIANVFYNQLLTLYQYENDFDLRFDPLLIKLIQLFDHSIYSIDLVNIPLNKKPKIRTIDDGEYLHEILELVDSYSIFAPENRCTDVTKANEFVDKVNMISWKTIVNVNNDWEDSWTEFIRGKGYHLSLNQKQNHKDNPDVKRKVFVQAIMDLHKNTINDLVKIYGDDKSKLCQSIIEKYESVQEE